MIRFLNHSLYVLEYTLKCFVRYLVPENDPRKPRGDRLETKKFHSEQDHFYMRVKAFIKKRGTTAKFLSTFNLVLISMSTLLLNGCASVFSVSEYPVHIDSVPSDMEIVDTDRNGDIEYRGRTPAVVNLDARGGYFVREKYTVKLYDAGNVVGRKQIDGGVDLWYFVNFLPWTTLVGFFVIDPLTGAMWSLDQSVTIFREVKTTDANGSSQQQVVNAEDISDTQQHSLIAQKSDEGSTPTSEKTQ